MPLLEAHDLVKRYPVRGSDGVVHALNGVSFALEPGETLGIVGESGCGKSTLARVLVRLEDPTQGRVLLDGVDLTALRGRRLRAHRRHIQMVFQDPFSSLDPRQPVGAALDEVLAVHRLRRPGRVEELLDVVGLPAEFAQRLPHEMSGGQRQRVGIARALAPEPRVLLLDESVSALDVSVRAEVMNLLAHLRAELGLAQVFISHDMAMVRQISDRVAVMYFGRVVEEGGWRDVLADPLHPYTAGLRAAVPVPDPSIAQPLTPTVVGEVPDPVRPPAGCPFHPRCPRAEDVCRAELPPLAEIRTGRRAACHVASRAEALR
ncbi:peptide/nickel transport system ATP-binding protein/oligopeptide transport system ATP-binding protein [Pseudonocardia hierapolitana]|uniref:Peptide/nickel transport system ATP-binding protein/oligopeptide transport system ATP-binding protein n=1 Tax=Pseudonocardia hierapolitana TaxID=1128676 RepID=A0A561T3V8_9PSEU|nr:ABC transporter ATP-binding protein [Pseudonocardia hierapolitana]TWF81803.1 peptide/nickel transport system ATP-binding protein/oligopeptide transport system ATP-binding protein [Pseudonocardia hierapolitana]